MVLYSNEIKDFLDKIFFYELTHKNDLKFSLYNYYKEKLKHIDKLSRHTPSSIFPMTRDKLFGLTIGRLEFGYLYDGVNVRVEYYVNCEPQNDWFDSLVEEVRTSSSDNAHKDSLLESIKSLFERMDNLYK